MKKNKKYIDDDHTIYNMDIDGLPNRKQGKIHLTPKEKKALIKACIIKFLPRLLGVIACFLLTMFLIYIWLN